MAVEVHMHHLRLLSLVNYLLSSMTEHDPGGHPNSQKDGRKRNKTIRFSEISDNNNNITYVDVKKTYYQGKNVSGC